MSWFRRMCIIDWPPSGGLMMTCLTESKNQKVYYTFTIHFPFGKLVHFSNLHQPHIVIYYLITLTAHLKPQNFSHNPLLCPRMSTFRHLRCLVVFCKRAEQWKISDAPPAFVRLHLHAKRAVETSSAVKCVERCWCFGGAQIHDRRRLNNRTIQQGWVTAEGSVWPMAISIYMTQWQTRKMANKFRGV